MTRIAGRIVIVALMLCGGFLVKAGAIGDPASPAGDALPELTVSACDQPPFLDGVLTDACWRTAAVITNFQVFKEQGKTMPQMIRLCRDNDWLFLAFEIAHPHPKFIKQTVFEQDGAVQQDDSLEIFLDPGTGGKLYLHYLLNAANIKADQLVSGGNRRRDYQMPWRSATCLTIIGWNAEIAIPLSALKRCRNQTAVLDLAKARMNLTITTVIPTFDPFGAIMCETSRCLTWSPLAATSHDPERFGALKGLPAFNEIQTAYPQDGSYLTTNLFLPKIAGVQVGDFALKDGHSEYTLNVALSNSNSVTGAADVNVTDRPVAGVATEVVQRVSLASGEARAVEVRVPIMTPGRRSAMVWLKDAERGGAFCSWLLDEQALIAMEPFTAVLDRNYYTSERSAWTVCRVRLPAETMTQCRIAVKTPDGRNIAQTKQLGEETRLEISLDKMVEGRTSLKVELQDAGEKCLSFQEVVLIKHRPNNVGGEIKVDQVSRILLKDGQPFFPFGLCANAIGIKDGDLFKRLADAGFNTVCWQRPGGTGTNEVSAYMELAGKYGLMVVDFIWGIDFRPYPANDRMWIQYEKSAGRSGVAPTTMSQEVAMAQTQFIERVPKLAPAIQAIKDHPSFLAHYNIDEPNLGNPETCIAVAELFYKQMVEWDPYHPTVMLFAGQIPSGNRWTDWCEILCYDVYVYPGWGSKYSVPSYMSFQTLMLKKRADAARKVCLMVPLAETIGLPRCARALRREEQRCQTYLTLIHGAKGLIYFTDIGVYSKAGWDTLSQLGREMKALAPAILAPEVPQKITYDPNGLDPDNWKLPDVQATLFRHPVGRYILVVANSRPWPVDTTFTVSGLDSNKTVKTLFTANDLPIKDGAFSERLEGYGTRAYLLEMQKAELRMQNGEAGIQKESQPIASVQLAVAMKAQKELYTPEPPFNIEAVSKRKNVMPNPSLEQMGVPGLPDFVLPNRTCPYKALAGEPGALWGVDTNNPFHGRYCVWTDNRRVCDPHEYCRNPDTHGVCYLPALTKPTPYVFSLYMHGGNDGDKVSVTMDSEGLKPETQNFVLTTDWQRYVMKCVMGSGGIKSYVITPAKVSMVWIDALQMEAGEEPTPFTEE